MKSNNLIDIIDLENEVDILGGRVPYQIKIFTCNLCGIKFTVESDSKIDEHKYCTKCEKENKK